MLIKKSNNKKHIDIETLKKNTFENFHNLLLDRWISC